MREKERMGKRKNDSHRTECCDFVRFVCERSLCMRTAKFITDVAFIYVYLNIACLIVVSLIEITFPFVTAVALSRHTHTHTHIQQAPQNISGHSNDGGAMAWQLSFCIVENKSISFISAYKK